MKKMVMVFMILFLVACSSKDAENEAINDVVFQYNEFIEQNGNADLKLDKPDSIDKETYFYKIPGPGDFLIGISVEEDREDKLSTIAVISNSPDEEIYDIQMKVMTGLVLAADSSYQENEVTNILINELDFDRVIKNQESTMFQDEENGAFFTAEHDGESFIHSMGFY